MVALLIFVALAAALFLLQEGLRVAGPWPAVGLYLVAPVLLTAYWLPVNDFGPFVWIKTYTVLFCACYGTALRYTALVNRPDARFAVTVLLALNILEAVALDLIGGTPAHALNAAAGLALVATLPWRADAVRVVVCGRRRDAVYDGLSRRWIVGYSVWNATFLHLNYPELAGRYTVVLAAALLAGAIDPRRWLQARAYTLAADLVVLASFYPIVLGAPGTAHRIDPAAAAGAALASLLVAVACVWESRPTADRRPAGA